ncbi:MAG: hypothetical protein CR991_06915 [Proteobacteria bacterium]|nr:MAG: hypothetical protein CR991_06915 [Pseudomonadota bacterium]
MYKKILLIMLTGWALTAPISAVVAKVTYGPVASQETLWGIASRLRPDESVTVQQTMLALYHKNPHAFSKNNINALQKGSVLQIPTLVEIKAIGWQTALRETRSQNRYWRKGTVSTRNTRQNRIRNAQRRSRRPVQKTTRATALQQRLRRQVSSLQTQLQQAKSKNRHLQSQLEQAKRVAASLPDAKVKTQLKQLKTELSELQTVLEQKDNHIKTLRASLKSASETIKAQHADNLRLYDKLKEVSPDSVKAIESDNKVSDRVTSSLLRLSKVGEEDKLPEQTKEIPSTTERVQNSTDKNAGNYPDETGAAGAVANKQEKELANNGNYNPSETNQLWADEVEPSKTIAEPGLTGEPTEANALLINTQRQVANDVHQESGAGISLRDMVSQNAEAGEKAKPQRSSLFGEKMNIAGLKVSPLSIAILLASLLFVAVLLWRAYEQQREIDRLKEQEKARGEKMRKRLVENSKSDLKRLKQGSPAEC